jgi:hypothetical protein
MPNKHRRRPIETETGTSARPTSSAAVASPASATEPGNGPAPLGVTKHDRATARRYQAIIAASFKPAAIIGLLDRVIQGGSEAKGAVSVLREKLGCLTEIELYDSVLVADYLNGLALLLKMDDQLIPSVCSAVQRRELFAAIAPVARAVADFDPHVVAVAREGRRRIAA